MKKLRMFMVSVIVIAIVSGAFAFNEHKGASFCYGIKHCPVCDGVLLNMKVVTSGGVPACYFANWDGDMTKCVGTSNCTTSFRLTDN